MKVLPVIALISCARLFVADAFCFSTKVQSSPPQVEKGAPDAALESRRNAETVRETTVAVTTSRRSALMTAANAALGAFAATAAMVYSPKKADALPDCMADCLKSCKSIAPKDPKYCTETCESYCAQDDREDGLSGSKSSEKGEVGILGTSTVVKGADRPPSIKLPGLDFTSEKGRKLIGY